MAFCAWCGNNVPQISYAPCARCGNPTNGSQRVAGGGDGAKTGGLIIGLIVGGLALVAFMGILAAIAIPNMLTAMQRSRQKRTMADMRSVAISVESYGVDKNQFPAGASIGDITPALVPEYGKTLPGVDGWGTPLRYECWPAPECEHYAIASAGADKTFEHESLQDYETNTRTSSFDSDIVWTDGKFSQYPEEPGGANR